MRRSACIKRRPYVEQVGAIGFNGLVDSNDAAYRAISAAGST